MNYFKQVLIVFILILSSFFTHAQQTGSFNTNIQFQGNQRELSFHVPSSYDSTKDYRLIVGLHGLGDNSKNFRNYLINNKNWHQHFSNTIIACPDGGDDRNSDFYTPDGDQQVIQRTIDYAANNYSIDTSRIILEGFSLGGMSALNYGLNHPDQFKGLLLNTPAIQGILMAKNDNAFNYQNASGIPIYITNGSQDVTYVNIVDTLHQQLVTHDGIVRKNTVQGLGHAIPNFGKMNDVIDFFNAPAKNHHDLSLVEINAPKRRCNGSIEPRCLVQNLSKQTVNKLTIQYNWGGNQNTHQWSGKLDSFEYAFVKLPALNASPGAYSLDAEVTQINGSMKDTVEFNNRMATGFRVSGSPASLPLGESFEVNNIPPKDWVFQPSGSLLSWFVDSNYSTSGNKSINSLNTLFLFPTQGKRENLLSPIVDLSSVDTPYLTFDVAFNFARFQPPLINDTLSFTDTLEVSISTDCGKTFKTIYRKSGKELSTFDKPIINPRGNQQYSVNVSSDNWRTEEISLHNYSDEKQATIRLSYISGVSGIIYIDNFAIQKEQPSGIKTSLQNMAINVYPNPATNKVKVQWENTDAQRLSLLHASGKQVLTKNLTGNRVSRETLNVEHLNGGIYFLELQTTEGSRYKKLVVE